MSWYTYEGFTTDKKIMSGKVWGDSEEEVQAKLAYQSITPIHLECIVVKERKQLI